MTPAQVEEIKARLKRRRASDFVRMVVFGTITVGFTILNVLFGSAEPTMTWGSLIVGYILSIVFIRQWTKSRKAFNNFRSDKWVQQ